MQTLVAACVLLASKVQEVRFTRSLRRYFAILSLFSARKALRLPALRRALQTPVKSVDLFNALKRCQTGREGSAADRTCGVADIIVGEEYETVKTQVYRSEQVLLRQTRFNLAFEFPTPFLLNFAKCLSCGRSAVQLAHFLANDSLVFTDMCLRFEGAELAAACLAVASLFLKEPLTQIEAFHFGMLGVSRKRVDAASNELIELLEHSEVV